MNVAINGGCVSKTSKYPEYKSKAQKDLNNKTSLDIFDENILDMFYKNNNDDEEKKESNNLLKIDIANYNYQQKVVNNSLSTQQNDNSSYKGNDNYKSHQIWYANSIEKVEKFSNQETALNENEIAIATVLCFFPSAAIDAIIFILIKQYDNSLNQQIGKDIVIATINKFIKIIKYYQTNNLWSGKKTNENDKQNIKKMRCSNKYNHKKMNIRINNILDRLNSILSCELLLINKDLNNSCKDIKSDEIFAETCDDSLEQVVQKASNHITKPNSNQKLVYNKDKIISSSSGLETFLLQKKGTIYSNVKIDSKNIKCFIKYFNDLFNKKDSNLFYLTNHTTDKLLLPMQILKDYIDNYQSKNQSQLSKRKLAQIYDYPAKIVD